MSFKPTGIGGFFAPRGSPVHELLRYGFYLVVLVIIVQVVGSQAVVRRRERLAASLLSGTYKRTVEQIHQLDHQVRSVELAFERRKLNKPDTRQKLLDLYWKYQYLLGRLSRTNVSLLSQPDDYLLVQLVMVRIRMSQKAINRWGREHGF